MIRVLESTQTEKELEILKSIRDNEEFSSYDEVRDEVRRIRDNYNYERDFTLFSTLSMLFNFENEANGDYDKGLELAIQQREEQVERENKRREESSNVLQDLNDRLKKCKTKEDLEDLRELMDSYGKGYHFKVKTKSGGDENGIWAYDDGTVEYITDRDSRVRKCRISNLWKSLYVGA